jgi:hypothetical protein
MRKTDARKKVRPAVGEPRPGHLGRFAPQCREGLGPNILIDIYLFIPQTSVSLGVLAALLED